MKIKVCLACAGMTLKVFCLPAFADSTDGAETVKFGNYSTSNWRSADFSGSSHRQWDKLGRSFTFSWNTLKGDQIGRIGVGYGSDLLGVRIDNVRPDIVMSTTAFYTSQADHWFYWSIYGWTHRDYTYWGNTPNGWDNEFYVIFYTDKTTAAFLEDKKVVPIGSVDVDGEIYDCYKTPRPFQSQWLAVRRTKTWSSSVNLKKIFDYWRSKGLPNDYVVDLGWALEGFIGSAGTLQLTDINIPDLKKNRLSPSR